MRLASSPSRALAAGPDNSTCVAAAAFTYGVLAYRFDEALELADRALMLHPNSVFVRNRVAAVYVVCGETDKAIAQCEAARRMNPLDSKKSATYHLLDPLVCALHGAPLRGVHPTPAGARWHSLRTTNTARKYVAASLAQLGRTDEARVEIAELVKCQPERFACALPPTQFPPQVDARAASGRAAEGGIAGRMSALISGIL